MKSKAERISAEKYRRDGEGRAVIDMNINDDGDFLSVYSKSDIPVISCDVAEFIENEARPAKPGERFTLRIHSSCIDAAEKVIYDKAIRKYYEEKDAANERELRRNNVIALLLLAAGILVLAFAVFFNAKMETLVWSEVIDIVAWVLIWEAVDVMLFRNNELRVNKHRYRALSSMKIEYYDTGKNEKDKV